jgi:hypothetical protein
MPTLYNQSRYQETAFSFPGVHQEARFLQSCIHKFSDIAVRRVAQVGCGYAPHAGELVRLGYSYIGLDSNRNMLVCSRQEGGFRFRHAWCALPELTGGDDLPL